MAAEQEKRYKATAKVVMIATSKKDLSSDDAYQNDAHVEFTDYKGEPAKGSFRICRSPLYTTIRTGSTVEIEYSEDEVLGGYTVFLLDPEKYKRIPTKEELAPYRRNSKRVLKQSLMGIAALLITVILAGITHSPLAFLVLVAAMFPIMKYGSDEAQGDKDKFLSWHQEENNE